MLTSNGLLIVKLWEQNHLTPTGRYKGPDLTGFGFPYRPGEYVPVDKRYSARMQYDHANTAKRLHATA